MANARLPLVPHPLAVVPHVLGQTLCAFAVPASALELGLRLRVHWWLPREFRRDFYERLTDKHCDRIKVRAISAEPEPLRLQGDRPPARKRIVDRRRFGLEVVEDGLTVALLWWFFAKPPCDRTRDLPPRLIKNRLVVRRFPRHYPLNNLMKPSPLRVLLLLALEPLRPCRRIIDQLSEQHRSPGR